jgi:translocation and assembly module TamB
LRTTARISGTYGEPRYHGEITGNGLAVRNLLAGVNVSGGQIDVRLEGDNARIERFTLRGGDGSLTLTGGATIEPRFQARLQAKAERFRVLARVDRSITASGNAELTLGPEQGRLDGRVTLDEGFFDASQKDATSLDSDVTIRQAEVPAKAVADAAPPAHPWRLGLGGRSAWATKLRFRGWGVDTGCGRSAADRPGASPPSRPHLQRRRHLCRHGRSWPSTAASSSSSALWATHGWTSWHCAPTSTTRSA